MSEETQATTQEVAPATAPAVPEAPQEKLGSPTQPVNPALDPHLTRALKGDTSHLPKKDQPQTQISQEPEQAPSGGLNDLTPEDIGSPELEGLGNLLIGAVPNLDVQRAIGNAIEYLDPDLVDVRYIQEIAGDKAGAVQALARQIVEVASIQSHSTLNAIHESAGGEANWQAAVGVFNKDAPKEMREVVASMLDSKNFNKIKSGAKFILDFAKQSGSLSQAPQYVSPTSFRGDASEALSKLDFQKALRKLAPEHVNPNWARERQDLIRKRTLGKQLGL